MNPIFGSVARCAIAPKPTALRPDPETGVLVSLFNPRLQRWREHFQWADGGLTIVGITAVGRATVAALHLDDDVDAITVRGNWILAGWHPPDD